MYFGISDVLYARNVLKIPFAMFWYEVLCPDAVLVQMLFVHFQVYILPLRGPVSIQRHAGLAQGVWLGAGSQLR